MQKVKLCDIQFNALTKESILKDTSDFKHIITVNPEFIVKAQENKKFKEIINNNLSTIDGQVTYFILKFKYPFIKFEKISGCDFIYDLCSIAQKNNLKVFLLGGYKESNKKSVEILKRDYKIQIDGFSPDYKPYPFDIEHNNLILKRIEIFKPDIIFVGFGALKQELWIADNRSFLKENGVKYAAGIGGTFEYISGTVKRAPRLIQKLGLESLYRLTNDPNYKFKRISEGLRLFRYLLFGAKK